MTDLVAVRFRRLADAFSSRADAVTTEAWESPTPCAGWVARDIVGHLVEWVPAFIAAGAGVELADGPSVDDDPPGAWRALRAGVQAVLDDPGVHERVFDHPMVGRHALDDAIAMFIFGDVLVHTWDLARSVGLDERLDPEETASMFEGIGPLDEILRSSGQYGPRVEVSDDADVQTQLLAFLGRRP